jgi:HNH endonuclease
VCWYCGTDTTEAIFEREHQVPLSLNGGHGDNMVDSCQPCNRLKSNRTVEQFRAEIEARLGEAVTFAGEATSEHPATDISHVRSFAAPTGLVRLPGDILLEARQAVLELRSAGYTSATLGGLVTDALRAHLDRLSAGELGPDDFGPQALAFFTAVSSSTGDTAVAAV